MTFGGGEKKAESLIVLAVILQRFVYVKTTFSKTQIEVEQFCHLSIHANVQQKGQPPKNVFKTKSATNDPIRAVESKSLKVQESLNKSQGNGK